MPQTFDTWQVKIGKDVFVLSEAEINALKSAGQTGSTLIWFRDFAISIPHISSIVRIKGSQQNLLPSPGAYLTPEERENLRKRMEKFKASLTKRV